MCEIQSLAMALCVCVTIVASQSRKQVASIEGMVAKAAAQAEDEVSIIGTVESSTLNRRHVKFFPVIALQGRHLEGVTFSASKQKLCPIVNALCSKCRLDQSKDIANYNLFKCVGDRSLDLPRMTPNTCHLVMVPKQSR